MQQGLKIVVSPRYTYALYIQILSRGKTDSASSRNAASGGPGSGLGVTRQSRKTPIPASLEDFIIKRDYTGARAFLEVCFENVQNP